MTKDKQDSASVEVDPRVSAHYQAVANEVAPEKLNDAVLRQAKQAANERKPDSWASAWYRPAAFVATVGLSIALLLQLTESGLVSSPAEMSMESVASPGSTQSQVADSSAAPTSGAASDIAEVPEIRGKFDDRTQPSEESLPTDPIDALRAAKEDTSDSRREPGGLAKATAAAAQSAARQSDEARRNATAASITPPVARQSGSDLAAERLDSELGSDQCSDEQKLTAETWWLCIQEFRESNRLESANSELDSLRQSFPDFELPD